MLMQEALCDHPRHHRSLSHLHVTTRPACPLRRFTSTPMAGQQILHSIRLSPQLLEWAIDGNEHTDLPDVNRRGTASIRVADSYNEW